MLPTAETEGWRRWYRLLLVEDDDDAREAMAVLLRTGRHAVVEANTGRRGVELALELQLAAAIIDLGLPDVDGYEVAALIRRAGPGRRYPLIALTGYSDCQQRATRAGFDAFVVKPVYELETL